MRTPLALASATAATGFLSLHIDAGPQYLARPDIRFIPYEGNIADVAVATRVRDTRPEVEIFRRATDAVARGIFDMAVEDPPTSPPVSTSGSRRIRRPPEVEGSAAGESSHGA